MTLVAPRFLGDNLDDAAAISRAVEAVLPDGMAATDETLEAINKACAGKTGVHAQGKEVYYLMFMCQTRFSLQTLESRTSQGEASRRIERCCCTSASVVSIGRCRNSTPRKQCRFIAEFIAEDSRGRV